MRNPNTEQLPAIEHKGGVVLSAGAGSGKTFVLVLHLVHLTRSWFAEWKLLKNQQTLISFLKKKYSETVLMTFTKLAAGEISVRVYERFLEEKENANLEEEVLWHEAFEAIDYVTITTIDGFFYKLVGKGFFKELPADVPIIMNEKRRKGVQKTFDQWWIKNQKLLSPELLRDASMYRQSLVDTLIKIVNDPILRDLWASFSPSQADPKNLDSLLLDVESLNGWNRFIQLSVEVPEESKKNKWVALADALNSRRTPIQTWHDLMDWANFIESDLGRTILNFGKAKSLVGPYFEEYKKLKKSIPEWSKCYVEYKDNFETRIKPWLMTILSMVKETEAAIDPSAGITYGDLEFYVLKSVRNKDVARKIADNYKYFVVDEFQDTSIVQFEALKLMALNDLNRLFCVGDPKQAIYGFRGGELKVFQDLIKVYKLKDLPLSSNYRSKFNIINFNNKIFTKLFPLGRKWEGSDIHTVEMQEQTSPQLEVSQGKVISIDVSLPDVLEVDATQSSKKSPSWRSSFLDRAEACVYADYILNLKSSQRTVAILYKKLAPSKYLMSELIKRDIGFTAQVKIAFKNDPVTGILFCLIEDIMASHGLRWAKFMVSSYMSLLHLKIPSNFEDICKAFEIDCKLYGIKISFELFMSRLCIGNSLYKGSLSEINMILDISEGNIESVYLRLKSRAKEFLSADFRFGSNSEKVIIQTSHGSKGLEYDVVLLGGIATNGISRNNQDWIGAYPGSVMWIENPALRKRKPTLQMMLEKELKNQKEFSETKRLFYVACTRAKEELVFIRFQSQLDQYKVSAMSWAAGLEEFLSNSPEVEIENTKVEINADLFSKSQVSKPFFHQNSLGLISKTGLKSSPAYGITPELAVTRLNSLLECPRKFYIKQVLKIDEPRNIRFSHSKNGTEDPEEIIEKSSSQRGSEIHLGLSLAIKNNMVLPLEWVNHRDKLKMQWALDELSKLSRDSSDLVSEEVMKFPFFGFMLTGIPDLVVKGPHYQIWDFKTGQRKTGNELNYWQQLMIYAYAMWSSSQVPFENKISISLCYVDSQELVTKDVDYKTVSNELFLIWKNLSQLHLTNLDHCIVCPYSEICPR